MLVEFPEAPVEFRRGLVDVMADEQRHTRLHVERAAVLGLRFGDNLVLLHWNLRKAGWLERPEQSSFYRSDADFQTFIAQNSARPSISKTNAKPETYLKPQLAAGTNKLASVNH
ncbi:MAG: hypothetical protein ACKV2Q_13120 [Planctomycetaceae bacterium]